MSGFIVVLAELKFQGVVEGFKLLQRPIGKGIYCLFLATFYINDARGSKLYILNIIISVLGIMYIIVGLCCKKKPEGDLALTTTA